MSKKALLLGGTGAMGVYIVPELLKEEYLITVTTRSKRVSDHECLEFVQGNAHDNEFLEKLFMERWDLIIDFMVYSTSEFESKIEKFLNNTEHYIFISSYRVFADSKDKIIESSSKLLDTSKDSEYLKTDEYALAKARQELIIKKSKLKNWTIVRPSITYSKKRFQLMTLEADSIIFRARLKLPVAVSEELLNKKTTMTWAGDVARMITSLANNVVAFGDDFNVVTDESVTWEEVLGIYRKNADLKVKVVSHSEYLKMMSNKYQVQYDRMFNRTMDNSKILGITGIERTNIVSINKGLAQEISDIMKNEAIAFPINYSLQAKLDKLTGSRIPLSNVKFIDKVKYVASYLGITDKIKGRV